MKPAQFESNMHKAAKELINPESLLTDIGLIVQGTAMQHTPVRTGTLRRSLTTRLADKGVYVGTAVEYAPYVHFGTRYMEARPFIQQGIDDNRSRIETMVAEFGGKVLDKVSG